MDPLQSQITPLRRLLITGSVMLATILTTVDLTIALVALPHMQGEMSASQEQMSWVLTSYIVAAAVMTPTTGVLSALFGRKNILLISVAGFTLASVLCGVATSVAEIVGFRLLQGVFGSALVPLSQATLLDTFPKKSHGTAMAMWSVGIAVGPILGPTLGGYLTEYYNWRWVFFINVPFGLMALFGILSFIPNTLRDSARRFDFLGFAFLSIAIASLQLMLDRGLSLDWFNSLEIVTEAVLCGLFFYLFLVHMFTAKNPFVEPGLFKDRNLVVGLILMFVTGVVLMSTLSLISPFLQQLMGFPVLAAGAILAPRGIGTMVSMLVIGRLIQRVDARLIMVAGILVNSICLWEMSKFTMDTSVQALVWTGVFQGFGMGCMFVPLSTLAFTTLAPQFRTEGAVMFSLMRNVGSSIGISIVVTILAFHVQNNHAAIAEQMSPLRDMMQVPNLPQRWDWHNTAGALALNDEVTRQATLIAYLNNFLLLMWINFLTLPLAFMLRPPKAEAELDLREVEA